MVFIVYLITLAPSVVQIDSGELAAVQATLGIAHPTGYPLFTLLGYLFLKIPSPLSKILMANLLAALWCSIAVYIFMITAELVLSNLPAFQLAKKELPVKGKHKGKSPVANFLHRNDDINENKKILSVSFGAFVLAFSRTFWSQSTSVEVYSLQLLLFTVIIYLLLKAVIISCSSKNGIRYWIFFALALALGFTNHMTTLFILPGTAYLYFNRYGFKKSSFNRIAVMLACFFPLLIAIYAYLPLRASHNPVINWGNPIDFERILRHVSGKQYQVWLFSSMDSAKKQLGYFLSNLPSEFAVVSLLFCLLGLYNSFKLAGKFFLFSLITMVFTVLYSINYDIHDIDSYFLLAYISLAFFAVFGILKVFSLLKSNKNSYLVPSAITALFITAQLYMNFRDVNQSGMHTFEDYTKSLIQSTAQNSIIFSYQWDYFISPSYYFQKVENFRPDAVIVDKELMRRSWYFNQLKRNHPELSSRLEPVSAPFLRALQPFERDANFNAALLENLYRSMMSRLVQDNISDHPFYIAPELVENEMARGEFTLPRGCYLVPDLFLFKVVNDSSYVPAAKPDFRIRFPKHSDNQYAVFIENLVGSMLVRRAMYEMKFDKADRAKLYIDKIKSDLPNYQIPYGLAQVFN